MNTPDPIPFSTDGSQRNEIKPQRSARTLYTKDRHKRACRMVGFALTANDLAIWVLTLAIPAQRLTNMEAASLGYAPLRALAAAPREVGIDSRRSRNDVPPSE